MAKRRKDETAAYACPACERTLYGWAAARHAIDGSQIVLDRCEYCGLVVTRANEPPDVELELATLERDGDRIIAPNRQSWQAGIGGSGWSGLEPEVRRLHLTPKAAELLFEKQGVIVTGHDTPFSRRAWTSMLLTMINAFTFRTNFARNARAERLPAPATLGKRAIYALDWFVTGILGFLFSGIAAALELVASGFDRGGVMVLETQRKR